jgi:hypothetical protein
MHQRARKLSQDEMEHFLKGHLYGRLGLSFENEPYVVPLAYGYDQGRIYFHSERSGKKLEFINKNDRVCFEVDDWENGWASVICYGKIALRDDLGAKRKCFELLTDQELDESQLRNLKIYIGIIQIQEMTGRCSSDFSF